MVFGGRKGKEEEEEERMEVLSRCYAIGRNIKVRHPIHIRRFSRQLKYLIVQPEEV